MLTLRDYHLIAKQTGQSVADLWKNNGNIAFVPNYGGGQMVPMDKVKLTPWFSLTHDPCPYLNDDLQCDVYEARPIACAAFPIGVFEGDGRTIKDRPFTYPCLRKGVRVRGGQVAAVEECIGLLDRERAIEQEILGRPLAIRRFASICELGRYLDRVKGEQLRNDPEQEMESTRRVVRNYEEIVEAFRKQDPRADIGHPWMHAMLGTFCYADKRDPIAESIAAIEDSLTDHFAETTGEYRRLLERLS